MEDRDGLLSEPGGERTWVLSLGVTGKYKAWLGLVLEEIWRGSKGER